MKRLEAIGEKINSAWHLLDKAPGIKHLQELQQKHFNKVAEKAQISSSLELSRNLRSKNWKDLAFSVVTTIGTAAALIPPYYEFISNSFSRIPSPNSEFTLGLLVALGGLHISFILNQDKKIITNEAAHRNLPIKYLMRTPRFPFIPRQAVN
jgi:hypothetical protein